MNILVSTYLERRVSGPEVSQQRCSPFLQHSIHVNQLGVDKLYNPEIPLFF